MIALHQKVIFIKDWGPSEGGLNHRYFAKAGETGFVIELNNMGLYTVEVIENGKTVAIVDAPESVLQIVN